MYYGSRDYKGKNDDFVQSKLMRKTCTLFLILHGQLHSIYNTVKPVLRGHLWDK